MVNQTIPYDIFLEEEGFISTNELCFLMQPDEDSLAPDDSVLPPLLQGDKADCASICSMESTLSIDLSRQRYI